MRSKTDRGSRRRAAERFRLAYSEFVAARQHPLTRRRMAAAMIEAAVAAFERGHLNWGDVRNFVGEALECE